VPVDAPDGTEADALAPPRKVQLARTVGRPRLSRISRAWTASIIAIQ